MGGFGLKVSYVVVKDFRIAWKVGLGLRRCAFGARGTDFTPTPPSPATWWQERGPDLGGVGLKVSKVVVKDFRIAGTVGLGMPPCAFGALLEFHPHPSLHRNLVAGEGPDLGSFGLKVSNVVAKDFRIAWTVGLGMQPCAFGSGLSTPSPRSRQAEGGERLVDN